MQLIFISISVLAIASIFYVYRFYHHFLMQQQRRLRERVACMLWTAANRVKV